LLDQAYACSGRRRLPKDELTGKYGNGTSVAGRGVAVTETKVAVAGTGVQWPQVFEYCRRLTPARSARTNSFHIFSFVEKKIVADG